jgi:2-iminobutanoate/2-iminopropanoate deaminase
MSIVHFENPPGVHVPVGYSHAGYFDGPARTIYLSGQIARNEKGETVGKGNLEEQTRQVYRNISRILDSMGASLGDVIKQNIYTTRVDQVAAIRKVRDEFFTSRDKPCSTLVGVAGLVSPDLLIEIEVIAVIRR